MIRDLRKYLFPPRTARQRLPLLPTAYTSDVGRYDCDPDVASALILAGVAITPADAARLMAKFAGKDVTEVIRLARRKRRFLGRFTAAWKRFKELW